MTNAKLTTPPFLAKFGLAAVASLALAPLALFVAAVVTVAGTVALGTGWIDPDLLPAALLTGLPLFAALVVVLYRMLWSDGAAV